MANHDEPCNCEQALQLQRDKDAVRKKLEELLNGRENYLISPAVRRELDCLITNYLEN